MTPIISAYRDVLFYKIMPDLGQLGIIFGVSIGLAIIGLLVFKRLQRGFAEEF